MHCPQCGAEYRTGFTLCSDCNVELVGELPAEPAATTAERRLRAKWTSRGGYMILLACGLIGALALLPSNGGSVEHVLMLVLVVGGVLAYVSGTCMVARGKGFSFAAGLIGLAGLIPLLALVMWRDKPLPAPDEWDEHMEELGADASDILT